MLQQKQQAPNFRRDQSILPYTWKKNASVSYILATKRIKRHVQPMAQGAGQQAVPCARRRVRPLFAACCFTPGTGYYTTSMVQHQQECPTAQKPAAVSLQRRTALGQRCQSKSSPYATSNVTPVLPLHEQVPRTRYESSGDALTHLTPAAQHNARPQNTSTPRPAPTSHHPLQPRAATHRRTSQEEQGRAIACR